LTRAFNKPLAPSTGGISMWSRLASNTRIKTSALRLTKFQKNGNEVVFHTTLRITLMASQWHSLRPFLNAGALLFIGTASQATTVVLYDQDFENPVGYNNDGGDLSIATVNQHYGGQPAGFSFAQAFTVETLNVSGSARGAGTAAHGTGWLDPTGIGGNFALGMLSNAQDDRLGLSFNVGALPFFNFQLDVSSIDLTTFGGPFVPTAAVPTFRFTLYDNPSGANTIGGGTVLAQSDFSGVASAPNAFDWRQASFGFSTAGNTNGNVTLQIDLLTGGYAAMDNFRITASTEQGNVGGQVPLPSSAYLLGGGLLGLGALARRHRRRRAG
jgi:hypothetical protein